MNNKFNLLLLLAASALQSCSSWFNSSTEAYTKSCGTFTLSSVSDKPPNFPVPELRTEVDFSFNAAKCGQDCNCQQIAYIQMIRFTDQTDEHAGENFQPSSDQEARMVKGNATAALNGWAIDRADGMKWAYYGRKNDDSWDDLAHDPSGGLGWHIQLGAPGKSAIIKDGIHAEKAKYRVDVVDVPVCISDACNGKILGYFGYSFIRTENAMTITPAISFTYSWMVDAFDAAVAEWNKGGGNKLNLIKIP